MGFRVPRAGTAIERPQGFLRVRGRRRCVDRRQFGGGIVRSRPALRAAMVGVAALTATALGLFLSGSADPAAGPEGEGGHPLPGRPAGAAPAEPPLEKPR